MHSRGKRGLDTHKFEWENSNQTTNDQTMNLNRYPSAEEKQKQKATQQSQTNQLTQDEKLEQKRGRKRGRSIGI